MNKIELDGFKNRYDEILERHWSEREEWGTTSDEIDGYEWLSDQLRDLLDDMIKMLENAFSEGISDE